MNLIDLVGAFVDSRTRWLSPCDRLEALRIERCSPSDLRRTFASWPVEAGVPLFPIAQAMEHKDTRMLERVYGRQTPEQLAALMARAMGLSERASPAGALEHIWESLTRVPDPEQFSGSRRLRTHGVVASGLMRRSNRTSVTCSHDARSPRHAFTAITLGWGLRLQRPPTPARKLAHARAPTSSLAG